ncbi:MAG: T9SS type A sorting domain-containing protein [Chitinophagaceae bacterium]|nr:T9SS type A sorting domain-containing protein [Chitinophagaceae bacterium]
MFGEISGMAMQLPCTVEQWGFDYVYTVEVNSFSSFYFGSKIYDVLPVNIISFTGKVVAGNNKLVWKASCTNAVQFDIERSTDGVNFTNVGIVKAMQPDCNNPFNFVDVNPGNKTYYYRLRIHEDNVPAKYSEIVKISRDGSTGLKLQFVPNPVKNNAAVLQIESAESESVKLVITDVAGRQVMIKQINIPAGNTKITLDISQLSSGVYQATYQYEGKNITTRFIKE